MPLQSWSDLAKEAGDTEFNALPAADYDMEVIEAKAKQTGNGKTMFNITCKVTSGPHAERRVWSNLVVSPENPTALNIFFRQMAALGISKDYFATNPSDHNVAEQLVGAVFRGQVVIRQWNGNDKNEIKGYSRLSASAPMAAPVASQPAPTSSPSSPPAPSGMTPAPQPASNPPAAAAAQEKTATPDSEPAPAPVTQPDTPPVADTQTPAPAPDTTPAPSPDNSAAATPPPAPF